MKYSKQFIILKQDRLGYGFKGKDPSGRVIIEVSNGEVKLLISVQDLRPENLYKAFLIKSGDDMSVGVFSGNICPDSLGRYEMRALTSSSNIFDSDISIDEIDVVAIMVHSDEEAVVPLSGYKGDTIRWKNNFINHTLVEKKDIQSLSIEPTEFEPLDEIIPEDVEKAPAGEAMPSSVEEIEIAEAVLVATEEVEENIFGCSVPSDPSDEVLEDSSPHETLKVPEANEEERYAFQSVADVVSTANEPENIEQQEAVEDIYSLSVKEEQSNQDELPAQILSEDVQVFDAEVYDIQQTDSCETSNPVAENEEDECPEYEVSWIQEEEISETNAEEDEQEVEAVSLGAVVDVFDEWHLDESEENTDGDDANEPDSGEITNVSDLFAASYADYTKPFVRQNKEVDWIEIGKKELALLGDDFQKIMSNTFVLACLKRYGHLLLGKVCESEKEEYYLGTPDIYNHEFRTTAHRLGFNQFKTAKDVPVRNGEFGYWLMAMTIIR